MSAGSEGYRNDTESRAIAKVMQERRVASFTIPGRLAGMNEYQEACRSHWSKGHKMKAQQEEEIGWAILAAKIKPFTRPVRVHILWIEPNNRRDIDNIAAAAKWVLDAMAKMRVIPNDNKKWLKGISHDFGTDKQNPRVIVTIEEATPCSN